MSTKHYKRALSGEYYAHFAYRLNLSNRISRQLADNEELLNNLFSFQYGSDTPTEEDLLLMLEQQVTGFSSEKAHNFLEAYIETPYTEIDSDVAEAIRKAIAKYGPESNEIKWLTRKPSKFKKAPQKIIEEQVGNIYGIGIWDAYNNYKIPYDIAFKGYWLLSDDSDERKQKVSDIFNAYNQLRDNERNFNQPFLQVDSVDFDMELVKELDVIRKTDMGWVKSDTLDSLKYLYGFLDRTFGDAGIVKSIGAKDYFLAKGLFDDQAEAASSIMNNTVTFLTGVAGTGKTFMLKEVLKKMKQDDKNIFMTALSGRAVKNFNISMNNEFAFSSGTIASTRFVPANTERLKNAHVLVIDEISMVDVNSLAYLLKMTGASQIILVGDVAQLPAIELDFYSKALKDGVINQITLTEPKRQGKQSGVFKDSIDIRNGNRPEFNLDDSTLSYSNSIELIVKVNPKADLFLVGTNKSADIINQIKADEFLNNGKKNGRFFFYNMREYGDKTRFLVTKNNAETGLMNGDVLVAHMSDHGSIYTFFDQNGKEYSDVDPKRHGIKLGFAMTIHKSQGSTIENVVTILDSEYMATRNLLYTAITRASKTHQLYEMIPNILDKAISKTVTYQDYDYHKMLEL